MPFSANALVVEIDPKEGFGPLKNASRGRIGYAGDGPKHDDRPTRSLAETSRR